MFYTTRLLFPRIYTDSGFMAVPARLLLGSVLIVCLMRLLLSFISGKTAAWVTFSVLLTAAALWWRRSPSTVLRWRVQAVVLISVLLLVWRLWPALAMRHLTPFEGTENHDDLWYVYGADWLFDHSLNAPVPSDPDFPFLASAGANVAHLPRIGAESLIVYLASIGQVSVAQAYSVAFAVGSVFLFYASALGLLAHRQWGPHDLPLALVIIAVSPVALFIFGNSNFSTCFGLVFLAGSYWFLRQALGDWDDKMAAGVSGIFLGALIASYPELLSVAAPAALVLTVQSSLSWRRRIGRLATVGLVAVLVAPMAIVSVLSIYLSASSAAQVGSDPMFLRSISWSNIVLILTAFDTDLIARSFGPVGVAMASLVILLSLVSAPRVIWTGSAGLLLGGLAIFVAMYLKAYGYGGMKAVEFLSLPMATMLGAAIGRGVCRVSR